MVATTPSRALIPRLFRAPKRERDAVLARLSRPHLQSLRHRWRGFENDGQAAPAGDWRTWLLIAGRGFGKTRAGAEWVAEKARRHPGVRIALIGATMEDARAVMVEGVSGLLSVLRPDERPKYTPATHSITFANGSVVHLFSAEAPEKLRGFQHHFAWVDELAKWARPQVVWDNLMMGLRLGTDLQTLVTTTPRPMPLLRQLMAAKQSVITQRATHANSHLSTAFRDRMEADYGGTRLGRQELLGEMLEDMEGALWTRDLLEDCRAVPDAPPPVLDRIVVGVDPAVGSVKRGGKHRSSSGDECGIVVAGVDRNGTCHVIADESVSSGVPALWTRKVAEVAAHYRADQVVVEANQGGAMVETLLAEADAALPIRAVHAWRAKWARAEPVSLRYHKGQVVHAGAFPALEDQLCGMIAGQGYAGPGRSPDRADALIWALAELLPDAGGGAGHGPRVSRV